MHHQLTLPDMANDSDDSEYMVSNSPWFIKTSEIPSKDDEKFQGTVAKGIFNQSPRTTLISDSNQWMHEDSRVEIHEELKRCFFALPCLLYTLCSKHVLKECMHGYIQCSLTIFPKAWFFWARCILEHKKFKKTTQKTTIILTLFTNLVPRSYRVIVNLGNLQPLGHGRYGYKTKQLSLFLKFDWQVLRDYSWRKENQKEREQFWHDQLCNFSIDLALDAGKSLMPVDHSLQIVQYPLVSSV